MPKHIHKHKDGSMWAKGNMVDGKMDGYWEWFRKDGSKMRSGSFSKGKQVGEWVTYSLAGEVVKSTLLDKKSAQDVKRYYDSVPKASAKQLAELRKIVSAKLKGSSQILKYGIPHFRLKARDVIAIGGFKSHVSIFPLGNRVMKTFAKDLAPYKLSAGTIQFPLSEKLPKMLIEKIVKERLKITFEKPNQF